MGPHLDTVLYQPDMEQIQPIGCHCQNRIERRNDMTAIAIFLAGTLLGSLTTITILALIGINDREDDV